MSITNDNVCALFTAEQSRRLDRLTGVDGFTLMKQAGKAVYQKIMTRWSHLITQNTLHIFCGAGNNAGDGYIIAICALKAGIKVNVVAVKPPEILTGDAALAWQAFTQQKGHVTAWSPTLLSDTVPLTEGDIVVDALLGTGLKGSVSDTYRAVIENINALPCPVVSVDIPSGLCADTGAVEGVAIQATMTVTLISRKQGLFTADGPQLCGECLFVDLNTLPSVYEQVEAFSYLLEGKRLSQNLRLRKDNTNKGSFGSLLLIGGEKGMGGAILMAAEAALASGVGRVTVLTRMQHITAFLTRCPEVMVYACESIETETLLHDKTVVVVGPGLGTGDWGRKVLTALKRTELPVLFDADALNLIAQNPGAIESSSQHVFTPHPGEAARLLKTTVGQVQRDRFSALIQLQKKLGGCVLLKGSGTLITVGKECLVCNKGNSGMAVAGCGDVLSGLIGGLLAQGYNPELSASLGVWLHALAGDEAMNNLPGKAGFRATELIPLIRNQINQRIIAGVKVKEIERISS